MTSSPEPERKSKDRRIGGARDPTVPRSLRSLAHTLGRRVARAQKKKKSKKRAELVKAKNSFWPQKGSCQGDRLGSRTAPAISILV